MTTNPPATSPRHWDSICLTIVTISTATIGATIVLAGIPDLSPDNGEDYTRTLAVLEDGQPALDPNVFNMFPLHIARSARNGTSSTRPSPTP